MNPKHRKRLFLTLLGVSVLALLVYGFLPDPEPVEVATVGRGPLQVIVEEEGETRVSHSYVISAPIAAFARRIDLREGDRVERGQEIVRLEPPRPAILDPRTREEAQARVAAAEAALAQAEQNARAAEAAAAQAERERARLQRLFEGGSATEQALAEAAAAAEQATASRQAAEAGVAAARSNLAAARAAARPAGDASLPVQEVLRAPVAGRVLAVPHQSAGMVGPGEPLIEVGDTDNLEVRVDVLSQDAVRIRPGTRVLLDQWGGEALLEAVVERVEPQGFTEVSSLGVEEKRVTVVADLTSPPDAWAGLGAGYRVLARFVLWEGDEVLQVPTSALFRTDDGWAVFVVAGGAAVRRAVEVGHQTGLAAEVVSGLAEGEAVIVHPGNTIAEGTRVAPRGG
jgi:HlyD family secretion protein